MRTPLFSNPDSSERRINPVVLGLALGAAAAVAAVVASIGSPTSPPSSSPSRSAGETAPPLVDKAEGKRAGRANGAAQGSRKPTSMLTGGSVIAEDDEEPFEAFGASQVALWLSGSRPAAALWLGAAPASIAPGLAPLRAAGPGLGAATLEWSAEAPGAVVMSPLATAWPQRFADGAGDLSGWPQLTPAFAGSGAGLRTASLSVPGAPGGGAGGQRQLRADAGGPAASLEGQGNGLRPDSALATTLLSDDNALPVPEPGTWALMLAGLGVVLAVARRRRRSA